MGDVTVMRLDSSTEKEYIHLLKNSTVSMFYHTLAYRDLLSDFLSSEPVYLVAQVDGRTVGALPLFVKENEEYGSVVNSLPFFGSNGGLVVNDGLNPDTTKNVQRELLKSLDRIAHENDSVSATVITSPFDDEHGAYRQYLNISHVDERITQIVEFEPSEHVSSEGCYVPDETPPSPEEASDYSEYLFTLYDSRCRRSIRKALKNGVETEYSDDFEELHRMHESGMENKGGTVKPMRFFEKVKKNVSPEYYDLIYATKKGEIIAGLLIFKFKDTVEYFTPAYYPEHRDTQATSLLIFESMWEAINDGYTYWNFGGTRDDQEALYRFKKQWGTTDYEYTYYVPGYNLDRILDLRPSKLLNEYKWFYTVPFDDLDN